MKLSPEGIKHLKKVEGFKNHPYQDTGGVPTIGIGFTFYPNGTTVTMEDAPITLAEAKVMLNEILISFERCVNESVITNINQKQYDALVSFCYNVGEGAFKSSTLLKRINENPNHPDIENQFKRWKYDNGKIVAGLIKRRNQEFYLYSS